MINLHSTVKERNRRLRQRKILACRQPYPRGHQWECMRPVGASFDIIQHSPRVELLVFG